MENAAEALKMAAWVLIFVVALSISINAFTQARQSIDIILQIEDAEYYYDDYYLYVDENKTKERVVGYETIIPTIYRAYKENYKICFYNDYDVNTRKPTNPIVLYTKIASNGAETDINYIDLENETIR